MKVEDAVKEIYAFEEKEIKKFIFKLLVDLEIDISLSRYNNSNKVEINASKGGSVIFSKDFETLTMDDFMPKSVEENE